MERRSQRERPILGPSFQLMSNWCSMSCAGCGIRVAAPADGDVVAVDPSHLLNAKRTLSRIRSALEDNGYRYALVEQSGGEPTHHPQIVEAIGEVFPDVIHKVITNGLPVPSIFEYLKRRRGRALVVVSLDHHTLEHNRLRLGGRAKSNPGEALRLHERVIENLDALATCGVPVVVSSTITKWNIEHYLELVAWIERRYPRQVQDGMMTPMPVSLVAFGNPRTGSLNPSWEQVSAFKDAVQASRLVTVERSREWFLLQLVAHYRQKWRHFNNGEDLGAIAASPSREKCEIYRHVISFNFQDEEILRGTEEALFQGFVCGVKALGNIGTAALGDGRRRIPLVANRPSNLRPDAKYFRASQIDEYLSMRDRIIAGTATVRMGTEEGSFGELRRGMCLLDDFDGVWWPFNMYVLGAVGRVALGEYCAVFRDSRVMDVLDRIRAGGASLAAPGFSSAGEARDA